MYDIQERVMRSNPLEFKGSNNHVDNVTWNETVDFCNKLSEQ